MRCPRIYEAALSDYEADTVSVVVHREVREFVSTDVDMGKGKI
jgi:hypothetical protein